jgi:hypothetical protein
MTALVVVVALDPEGQITLQFLRSDQPLAIVFEVQLQLESGEKAFRHSDIPASARRSLLHVGRFEQKEPTRSMPKAKAVSEKS